MFRLILKVIKGCYLTAGALWLWGVSWGYSLSSGSNFATDRIVILAIWLTISGMLIIIIEYLFEKLTKRIADCKK